MRVLFAISITAVSFLTLATLAGLIDPMAPLRRTFPMNTPDWSTPEQKASSLGQAALDKVLVDASPIFGQYRITDGPASRWMKDYDDGTPITHMNIPGTHDTATWNYSAATQASLRHITDLINPDATMDSTFFRCHRRPIIDMLDAGIRAFDLRYALDVTKSSLVFWHGRALLSETATLHDVLFGFYRWLDDHPSEALLLSLKFDGDAAMDNFDSIDVQTKLYDALTSPAAKKYILQRKDSFGTLGEARGKVVLLRRFDLDLLPSSYERSLAGVHFSPKKWTDNGANIKLVYNEDSGDTAYIQDYFHPETERGSSAQENIETKYNATIDHLEFAASAPADALIWNFASSTNVGNTPPNTPRLQALGDGSVPGVNQRLVPFLQTMKGKRLGILMLDFYEQPDELVSLFLSLLEHPPKTRRDR